MIPFGSSPRVQMVSIAQIRAARGLLGWSQAELARAAGLSHPTIKRLESEGTGTIVSDDARSKVVRAFEAAGVEFTNGGEPGVKLRRTGSKDEGTRVSDLTSDNDS